MSSEQKDGGAASGFDGNAVNAKMDLQSRTMAALGVDLMRDVGTLEVLILGQNGVGLEAAKNLALQGVKAVTVWDNDVVTWYDLGTNFYATPEDVGKKTRAEATITQLKSLNRFCPITHAQGEAVTEELVKKHGAVLVCKDLGREVSVQINGWCRQAGIPFIMGVTHGLFAVMFSDFGSEHKIKNASGATPKTRVVSDISLSVKKGKTVGVVRTTEKHLLVGRSISFSQVTGEEGSQIEELNNISGIRVKRVFKEVPDPRRKGRTKKESMPFMFELDFSGCPEGKGKQYADDAKALSKLLSGYKTGGIVTEVIANSTQNYQTLDEALDRPALGSIHSADGGSGGDGKWAHFLFSSYWAYHTKEKKFPRLHNNKDAGKLAKLIKARLEKHQKANEEAKDTEGYVPLIHSEEVSRERINKLAWYGRVELTGICALVGGVVAQEVFKIWGKYSPIKQWIYLDYFSMLGADKPLDLVKKNSYYDNQLAVFGEALQEKIGREKWFMIGVGALGCEYLKAMALMGICAGKGGRLTITDMDQVELSNLSRQFLFRDRHIKKYKSVSAGEVISEMRPHMKKCLDVRTVAVGSSTEDVFDDAFWDSLTGAWNALDNIPARIYTDSKCLWHALPLLESGTQSVAATGDVILPYKTTSYSDNVPGEGDAIPMCTLKMFPNKIEHCIELARSEFFDAFTDVPKDYNSWLSDPTAFFSGVDAILFPAKRIKILKRVVEFAQWAGSKDLSYADCVRRAWQTFHAKFNLKIQELLHFHPADSREIHKASGADLGPFWSSGRRLPTPAGFDPKNKSHVEFLRYTANLFASVVGLDKEAQAATADSVGKLVSDLKLAEPEFVAPASLEDEDEEDGKTSGSDEDEKEEAGLRQVLKDLAAGLKQVQALKFEKDDDKNFHIDWMTAFANLRATNYSIENTTRFQVKVTAGRILPALATTTAAICGAVCMEYIRLAQGTAYSRDGDFRNCQLDLGLGELNLFCVRDPKVVKAKTVTVATGGEGKRAETREHKVVPYPGPFTTWSKLEIDAGRLTVEELAAAIGKRLPAASGKGGHVTVTSIFAEGHSRALYKQPKKSSQLKKVEAQLEGKTAEDADPKLWKKYQRLKATYDKAAAKSKRDAVEVWDELERKEKGLDAEQKSQGEGSEFVSSLLPKGRNYLVLSIVGKAPESDEKKYKMDVEVLTPKIKYVFA